MPLFANDNAEARIGGMRQEHDMVAPLCHRPALLRQMLDEVDHPGARRRIPRGLKPCRMVGFEEGINGASEGVKGFGWATERVVSGATRSECVRGHE